MSNIHRPSLPSGLVARNGVREDCIRDLAGFAWEILRRRSDYVGEQPRSVHRIMSTLGFPIEIIAQVSHPSPGGLLFR